VGLHPYAESHYQTRTNSDHKRCEWKDQYVRPDFLPTFFHRQFRELLAWHPKYFVAVASHFGSSILLPCEGGRALPHKIQFRAVRFPQIAAYSDVKG